MALKLRDFLHHSLVVLMNDIIDACDEDVVPQSADRQKRIGGFDEMKRMLLFFLIEENMSLVVDCNQSVFADGEGIYIGLVHQIFALLLEGLSVHLIEELVRGTKIKFMHIKTEFRVQYRPFTQLGGAKIGTVVLHPPQKHPAGLVCREEIAGGVGEVEGVNGGGVSLERVVCLIYPRKIARDFFLSDGELIFGLDGIPLVQRRVGWSGLEFVLLWRLVLHYIY